MTKGALLVALLIACAWTIALADDPVSSRLDRGVQAEVSRGFSGAVLVAKGEKILLERGYFSEHGSAIRANSKFWIASAGKQFVSAALFKCKERGWVSLDDTLPRFFPDVPMDKRAITVRQLLAHLSGLDQTYASEGLADRGEAVRHMLGMPLIDKPGHKFHYSNDNYELTAAIIEVVSGEDYRNFVQEELWSPVGMRETGFSNMPAAKEVVPTKNTLPPRVLNIARGEAGVYSTTRDLFVWYRALRAGRVLTRADTDALFTPVTPIGEGKAALGWFIGKTAAGIGDIFTRGNEDFGANSLLYAYPHRGVVVVVLTHAGMADGEISWSRAVLKKIEAILFGPDERGKR